MPCSQYRERTGGPRAVSPRGVVDATGFSVLGTLDLKPET
jgi:hypothetical protein